MVVLTIFFTRAEAQRRGERKKRLFSTEKRPKNSAPLRLCARFNFGCGYAAQGSSKYIDNLSRLTYYILIKIEEFEDMKTKSVGELKAHFSEVLENVKNGESIAISYGRKKKKVAVIIPYDSYKSSSKKRKIGICEKKATYRIHEDFKLSDEQFLKP